MSQDNGKNTGNKNAKTKKGIKRREFVAGAAAAAASTVLMAKWSEALAQAGEEGGVTEWRVVENVQIAQVQPSCSCGCGCSCGCA